MTWADLTLYEGLGPTANAGWIQPPFSENQRLKLVRGRRAEMALAVILQA